MGLLNDVFRREVEVGDFLPYTNLVTPSVVAMGDIGAYVFTVEMTGVAHVSADAADINDWHAQLTQLTRQIADPRVALHAHAIHYEVSDYPCGEFSNDFARKYNDKYRKMLATRHMHATRHFLSVMYQPQAKAEKFMARFSSASTAALAEQQAEDITAVNDLAHTVLAGLADFGPTLLSTYERDGVMYSRTLELYAYLLNGAWRSQAVPRAEIRDMLCDVRPIFGKGGLMSLKGPTSIEYCALLGIKEYPSKTFPGRLDGLMEQSYPWVLSQSFAYTEKFAAQTSMEDQSRRLANSGDHSGTQVDGIDDALDELASNEITMGRHELSLRISAPSVNALNERVAAAGIILSNTGMKWVREDIAMGSAFFATLPGNLKFRIAPAMINNNNFSGLISPHNHTAGRLAGAQWGDAVTLFESSAGTPVAFNWHQPDPDPAAKFDANHKEPATALVVGPTGKGKTVLLGHLLTQTQKFGTFPEGYPFVKKLSCVVFDKDLGMAITVPALGGKYYRIRTGLPSGLAPCQMEPNEANLAMLDQLVTHLVTRPNLPLSLVQQKKITEAIAGVISAPKPLRRLGAMLEFFDENEVDGLHARLAQWCAGGKYGWLFDNEIDGMEIDYPVVGFDVTDFLLHREICTPLMMYLLHRVEQLTDGRRIPIFIDEAPTLLIDPVFAGFIDRALVQIRKKDGFLVLAAQFPHQILNSPLAAALVSQPATMIFLGDPKADMRDLVRGFKLSVSEVEIIRRLGKRQALLCQGGTSSIIDLTLTDCEDEIAVFSGNTATSRLCGELMDELGHEPEKWLEQFQQQRKGFKL